MSTALTIHWPTPLLEEARKAALLSANQTVESFIMQAVLEKIQRETLKPSSSAWPQERISQDIAWTNSNYALLAEKYANQWIYVHSQKVCGANRDMGKAEEEAEQLLGNLSDTVPIALFVATGNYVY